MSLVNNEADFRHGAALIREPANSISRVDYNHNKVSFLELEWFSQRYLIVFLEIKYFQILTMILISNMTVLKNNRYYKKL